MAPKLILKTTVTAAAKPVVDMYLIPGTELPFCTVASPSHGSPFSYCLQTACVTLLPVLKLVEIDATMAASRETPQLLPTGATDVTVATRLPVVWVEGVAAAT